MKKLTKIQLALFLIFPFSVVFCQDNEISFKENTKSKNTISSSDGIKMYLGINSGFLKPSDFSNRLIGGIEFTIKFENNIGIYYSLLGGNKFFNMPAGPILGVWGGALIANSEDKPSDVIGGIIFTTILGSLIPEGIFYEINLKDKYTLSPYINPLQFNTLTNTDREPTNWSFGGSGGVRFNFYLVKEKLRLSPYFEYKTRYNYRNNGSIMAGINLSIRTFEDKK
jgi:hypothetical protein